MTQSLNTPLPFSSAPISAVKLAATAGIAALAMFAAGPAAADGHSETGSEAGNEAGAEALTEGQERLARLLEGRVAGEPQNCIRTRPNYRLTVIDDTAYVYGRGRTIYVQRTRDPGNIDDNDALVSRRFGASQLCRQDVVNTIDPVLGFFTGAVFFEEFIPYTRVEEDG